jgi:hypothetical protein
MAMTFTAYRRIATCKRERGFALLIAVIFMSVMLTFGLSLGSLAYKQQVLASGAIASQYAFYVADAGLECALYADQQQNLFAYPASAPSAAPSMNCEGAAPVSTSFTYSASQFMVFSRLSLDSGQHCVDVTVYKPAAVGGITYLFSQGYNVSCATIAAPTGARFVSRGLKAQY